jgi:hypothetical protein
MVSSGTRSGVSRATSNATSNRTCGIERVTPG